MLMIMKMDAGRALEMKEGAEDIIASRLNVTNAHAKRFRKGYTSIKI